MSSLAQNSPAPNSENGPATEVDRHQLQPVKATGDSTRISVEELVDDQPSAPSPGNGPVIGGEQVQPVVVRDTTKISVEEIRNLTAHEFNNRIINRSAVEKLLIRNLRSDLSGSRSFEERKLRIRVTQMALANIAIADRGRNFAAHLDKLCDRCGRCVCEKLCHRLVIVDEQHQSDVVPNNVIPPSNPFLLSDTELMGLSIREFNRGLRKANVGDEQKRALMIYRRELRTKEFAKKSQYLQKYRLN